MYFKCYVYFSKRIFLSCYIDFQKLLHGLLFFVFLALCQTKPSCNLTKISKLDVEASVLK